MVFNVDGLPCIHFFLFCIKKKTILFRALMYAEKYLTLAPVQNYEQM